MIRFRSGRGKYPLPLDPYKCTPVNLRRRVIVRRKLEYGLDAGYNSGALYNIAYLYP